MRILDVGSGTLPLHEAMKTEHELIRLDIRQGSQTIDMIGDAHTLPFKDQSFDLIYCSHVLEHVHYPLTVLREFKRVGKRSYIRVPLLNSYSELNCLSSKFDHLYMWNYFAFQNLLNMVFDEVELSIRINSLERFAFWKRFFIILKRVALQKKDELVAICR